MINDQVKTAQEVAKEMFDEVGKDVAIQITENAIDEKRKQKVSSIATILWVQQIEFLREVLQVLKNGY